MGPTGLASWAWRTAAELLMSPPVEPFGSPLALDLGALVVAIESTQPQLACISSLRVTLSRTW